MLIIQDELKVIQEFQVKKQRDLWAVCSHLKIKGVKNASKESMLQKIVSIYKVKERYGKLTDNVEVILSATRKELQWPCRLMHILFSDSFSEGWAQVGKVEDWAELDAGKASNNRLFWEGVQESFESQDEFHDNLHFAGNEVLSDLHHINFQKIVYHDWKKLPAIWTNLNAKYKAVLSRYTMSGTHSSNFYEFYNGWHEIYYLRKYLEATLNLSSIVAADLPEKVFMDSTERPSSTSSTSTKHEGDKGSKIIDLLCDIQSGSQQAELSKHKLDQMEKMELQKAKEDYWKAKDEARKEREEECRNIKHLF